MSEGPKTVAFTIGWACNADCLMCWQAKSRSEGKLKRIQMSYEAFEAVIDRYGDGLEQVYMQSFGEPMVHKDFKHMVRRMLGIGIAYNLITNGSLLMRYPELSQLSGQLTISFDSPERETYEQIRRGLRFDRVRSQIKEFMALDRHIGRSVGFNMVILTINAHQIEDMMRFAKDLGVDYVVFIRGEAVNTTDAADLGIPEKDLQGITDRIARLREEYSDSVRAVDNFSPNFASIITPTVEHCVIPWNNLDIGPDGHAHVCCRTFGTDLGDAVTGDPWNHPWLVELRKQILEGEVDPKEYPNCHECPNLFPSRGARCSSA